MAEEEKVETTEAADTKAAKKGKKKWPVVVGVVAVVIVAAGAGFWVWHEQPELLRRHLPHPDGRVPRDLRFR